ncbi:Uncharacterised protein [Shigella sonnei]|nr:Uncharacterised protein [Shigella sonnei]
MDRNGLRQSYAMLDCRYICPTALRRIFHSFSAALVQNWKIWRQRIPRLLATARQANCAYSLTIRCLNGL